ncbi:PIN/TRAM domain-containing protein [cf. Phormidesmis sp. LEGE 11477]|uniref:PIN/TRAM domain-containing protein n=1 Tax=cf. Phormidesmis sp. LEGE 11477 TaxID=1828680 RepID=UPI00188151D0|nr:PIN/TRAM domain-containing protein [cf. Phormidesmis sp. LEGE 11477]MBE9062977.1 PIN/TRAM domain-containing protein [cf. Phormidesmis sp. LEGE 11477]
MLDALIVFSFILTGAAVGFFSVDLLPDSALAQVSNIEGLESVTAGFGALVGVAIGLIVQTSYRRIEKQIIEMPPDRLLARAVGLVVGLLIANLMLAPLFLLPFPVKFSFIKPVTAVMGSLIFAVTGMSLAETNGRALFRLVNPNSYETLLISEGTLKPSKSKVLDTSSIIDGRIEDLLKTGFIEGQLLLPQFILQELQRVADSASDQKRARGRRGLDIINRIRKNYPDRVIVDPADYDDINAVDSKLVKLAQEMKADLLTTDYNLNKVASVQQVSVLNINDLAKALRPTYLPGDDIEIRVLKEGKEPSQGVGYLNDGTMVVVEEGNEYIGDNLVVVVTGALQTSAGRMIFARPNRSAMASS